ncbi:MAG TPA: BtrH N-terminal domain-containing protein [Burkholderiaceae bacterium]|nr:BtrH N-terminal domain-containing protein [Burkholderiaceae bacterium]
MGAIDFQHQQSAHCESGVVAGLLRGQGCPLTEAMVFGLASALAFAYLGIVKINEMPLISYRMPPRFILRRLRKLLRLPLRVESFATPQAGERRLDELVARGTLVGLQSSVYFLPYIPVNMRFHFNAHNLLVYGREDDEYLISDPVFEAPTRSSVPELTRARFARGVLAPRGLLYYLDGPIVPTDVRRLIPGALKKECRTMLQPLLPFVGVRGIRMLARKVHKVARTAPPEFAQRFVGHVVRMQEEIGTGGGGFRFLYGAFLQEAGTLLGNPSLQELALQMVGMGDLWRDFAYDAARMSKGRLALDGALLSDQLNNIAEREAALFRAVRAAALV